MRQVLVAGNVAVGRKSRLGIRGDNIAPGMNCSQIDGNLSVTCLLAQARVLFTSITGANAGANIQGGSTGIGNCDNLP